RAQAVRQALTVEQLHREVRRAVGVPADVVDLDDARVVDVRGGLRFVEEPLDDVALARQLRQQLLDRGAPAEPRVDADVDDPEPAPTELLLDQICTDLCTDHRAREPTTL